MPASRDHESGIDPKGTMFSPIRFAALVTLGSLCASVAFAAEPWIAPTDAKSVKNPVAADASSLAAGKAIYAKRCEDCHGKAGAGDGPDASDLSRDPATLYDEDVRSESDGELFWKIRTGRKPMPKYQTRISEEDTWHVINYLRTFKAPQ